MLKNVHKNDGWRNQKTGLGTSRSRSAGAELIASSSAGKHQYFDALYSSDDVAATLAELPAREMLREGVRFSLDDETEEKKLIAAVNQLGVEDSFFRALVFSRVFGGSIVLVNVDDGRPFSEPVDFTNIKRIKNLVVLERPYVQISKYNADILSPNYTLPIEYRINSPIGGGAIGDNVGPTNFEVHADRVIQFMGVQTTNLRRIQNQGWGDSIFIRVNNLLASYGLAWESVGELIQDFVTFVYSAKGLRRILNSDASGKAHARMLDLDTSRSVARMIPVDPEAQEKIEKITSNVTGLPDLIDRLNSRLASALRMPVTLLMGQSPGGLNATGESDLTIFYDHIKALQKRHLLPAYNKLIPMILASKNLAFDSSNCEYEFRPLWAKTDLEKAQAQLTMAQADQIYHDLGVLDSDQLKQRFGKNGFDYDSNFLESSYSQELRAEIEELLK